MARKELIVNVMHPNNQPFRPVFTADTAPIPTFKIFVAYEDAAACARARKIHDQLETICNSEVKLTSTSMSFTLFDQDQAWKSALAEAATADVIMISTSTADELPVAIAQWIEAWPIREQNGQDALIVVFDTDREPGGEQRHLVSKLRKLAESRGLEFFCNQEIWPRRESILQSAIDPWNIGFNAGNRRVPFENWGLND